MIETLRGKEAVARSEAAANIHQIRRFWTEVVDPTFNAVTGQKHAEQEDLAASKDILDQVKRHILQSSTEALLKDMGVAFCLSMQAIWERGFRAYVRKCAQEIPSAEAETLSKATPWAHVKNAFELVQGRSVSLSPESSDLELLHTIGNACRHGPGKSLDSLMRTNPELWPMGVDVSYPTGPMQGLVISHERLLIFANSVLLFWASIDHELHEQQYSQEEHLAYQKRDAAFRSVNIEVHREAMRKALIEQFTQSDAPPGEPFRK